MTTPDIDIYALLRTYDNETLHRWYAGLNRWEWPDNLPIDAPETCDHTAFEPWWKAPLQFEVKV